MTKRIFYLSLSLLCLVCAYQLGADRARADWDTGLPGQVIGLDYKIAWAADGSCWSVEFTGWERHDVGDLPVPVGDVKLLSDNTLITNSDVAYRHGEGAWHYVGPFPGGPVPLQSESWGKVKGRYHD